MEGSSTNGDIAVDPDVELTIVATENPTNELNDIILFPNPSSSKVSILSKMDNFSHFMVLNSKGKNLISNTLQATNTQIDLRACAKTNTPFYNVFLLSYFVVKSITYPDKFML